MRPGSHLAVSSLFFFFLQLPKRRGLGKEVVDD